MQKVYVLSVCKQRKSIILSYVLKGNLTWLDYPLSFRLQILLRPRFVKKSLCPFVGKVCTLLVYTTNVNLSNALELLVPAPRMNVKVSLFILNRLSLIVYFILTGY